MGHPVFVKEIRVSSNEVVLGDSNCVFKRHLTAKGIHYMGAGSFEVGERMVAKIRYSHAGEWCTVLECKNDTISLEFDQPVRAITPGQAVVFYKEDYVLGGATIIR